MAFYQLAEIPLAQLSARDAVLDRIFRRELNGVIVKGFLDPARAAAIVARLEAGAITVPRRRFAREFEAYSIGPCLDQAEHGLDAYFAAVPAFSRAVATLFDGDLAFDGHLGAVLGTLASPRPIVVPRAPAGRPYGRTTLRCLPPGGLIPPHAENEQLLRAPYDHLRALLDPAVLLSFYLTLAPAESGGELALHALGWDELDRVTMRDRHSHAEAALEGRERCTMKPLAGDLIVFDGGRFFHQVLPVGGGKNRWTMGGFLALSADGRAVLTWA